MLLNEAKVCDIDAHLALVMDPRLLVANFLEATGAHVAALVEHRTRAEKDLDDEAFLCAAADNGAKTHAPVAALVPEMVRPDDAGGASETWTDKKTRKATASATATRLALTVVAKHAIRAPRAPCAW